MRKLTPQESQRLRQATAAITAASVRNTLTRLIDNGQMVEAMNYLAGAYQMAIELEAKPKLFAALSEVWRIFIGIDSSRGGDTA